MLGSFPFSFKKNLDQLLHDGTARDTTNEDDIMLIALVDADVAKALPI